MRAIFIGLLTSLICSAAQPQTLSPLFARGYTVLPEPQKVTLGATDFPFDRAWQLQRDSSVPADAPAVEILHEDLAARFHLRLGAAGQPSGTLSLRIEPATVAIGQALDPDKGSLQQQAYKIDLRSGAVAITANAETGLFYGVETFLQLLRAENGTLWLPEGAIEDWPDLHLRHIYWDDNHHLEKVDELKRVLRQAAFYKINGVALKLDGHFQYKSAPAVVEPYALTPAELQDLTDYGLRYHVELIPYLDGPAHISFILKHPEYAKLREFPDSNYEICAVNPESYKLLEGMYQDLLDANRGVRHFYLSTDESYYLGLAHNAQCDEQTLAKRLGSPGQIFAQFVQKTGGYLHSRGRTVVFWGEYPLKPSDLSALPDYLVNGEVYGAEFDKAFRQRGIRQMIFTSVEGEENLFPDYFLLPPGSRRVPGATDGGIQKPRLDDILTSISSDSSRTNSSLMGEVDAGWADEGVNPETFWLGYVASSAAGWHPGSPHIPELKSAFYSLFYGDAVAGMDQVYQLMSEQAQFWTDTWDVVPSTARKRIWGSSYEIYARGKPALDQTLPLPPLPDGTLQYRSTWATTNAKRVASTLHAKGENDRLVALLHDNLRKATFNRYNLEVYLTIADLCRQNLTMIEGIAKMDAELLTASRMRDKDATRALRQVDDVLDQATSIWRARNEVVQNTTATWYQRRFPRVEEANGRRFLNELDDVKDHLPGRTIGMTYLVYREEILPFGKWANAVAAMRNQFARAHNQPLRNYRLNWDDFSQETEPPQGL